MSEQTGDNNRHLPASALDEWVRLLSGELGLDELDPISDTAIVLDVAKEVAYSVARPAAPVSTFLLGLAAGRAGGDPDTVRALAEKIMGLARDGQE